MIAILKEGGATAQQFSDAQKLYELERARAIEQTTSAIQGYIDEMIGGQSSPLNKGTVYRSEEHTSELQSLMRISYAVFCLKKKKQTTDQINNIYNIIVHTAQKTKRSRI